MKKILACLLTILTVVACLTLCACTTGLKRADISKKLKKCDKHQEATEFSDGGKISVKADVYAIYVRETDASVCKVHWVEDSNVDVDIQSSETALEITQSSEVHLSVQAPKELLMVVEIPERWNNVELEVDAGTGSIQIEDLHFASIGVTVTTGTVIVDDCDVTGEIAVTATTGAVDIEAESASLIIVTTTGAIKFETNATEIVISATTGSIRGEVDGNEELYSVSVSTTVGSANLKNSQGDDAHSLKVDTTTGSIRIKFDK